MISEDLLARFERLEIEEDDYFKFSPMPSRSRPVIKYSQPEFEEESGEDDEEEDKENISPLKTPNHATQLPVVALNPIRAEDFDRYAHLFLPSPQVSPSCASFKKDLFSITFDDSPDRLKTPKPSTTNDPFRITFEDSPLSTANLSPSDLPSHTKPAQNAFSITFDSSSSLASPFPSSQSPSPSADDDSIEAIDVQQISFASPLVHKQSISTISSLVIPSTSLSSTRVTSNPFGITFDSPPHTASINLKAVSTKNNEAPFSITFESSPTLASSRAPQVASSAFHPLAGPVISSSLKDPFAITFDSPPRTSTSQTVSTQRSKTLAPTLSASLPLPTSSAQSQSSTSLSRSASPLPASSLQASTSPIPVSTLSILTSTPHSSLQLPSSQSASSSRSVSPLLTPKAKPATSSRDSLLPSNSNSRPL